MMHPCRGGEMEGAAGIPVWRKCRDHVGNVSDDDDDDVS